MARAVAVVLGFASLLLLGQGRVAGASELLVNGGFEEGTVEDRTVPWQTSHGILDAVAFPVHGGSLAGRLTGASVQIHEVYQFLDVAPGLKYELSGWLVKNDPDVARVLLRILWFDQTGAPLSFDEADSPWLTIDDPIYQPLTTGPRPSPPQAAFARVSVFVQPLNVAPFEVFFDDLSFTAPPPSSPAPPTPSPVPTPAPPTPAPAPTPTPVAGSAVQPPAPPAAAPPELDVYPSLFNGGFEEARQDGTPLGWRQFGGEAARSQAVRAEGGYSAAFSSRTPSTKWVYQTVTVVGGAYYSLAAQALKDDPAAETFLRLSWYATPDGSGSALDSADSRELLTTDSSSFRTLATGPVRAPPEARSAKVRLMLRPLSAAPATVYFDAVTFGPASPGEGVSAGDTGRNASAGGGSSASAAPVAAGLSRGRTQLANVKPSAPARSDTAGIRGGGSDWLYVALALGVPSLALAGTAAYEWRRRRLAAGDDRHL